MNTRRSIRLVVLTLVCAGVILGGDWTTQVAAARATAPASAPLQTIHEDAILRAVHERASLLPDHEGAWAWPIAAPHPVTRPFEVTGPYAAGHRGIDVGVPAGAAVVAPAAGTVRFAGVVVDRPVLSIAHDDGSISSFEPVDPVVEQGDRIEGGQLVGHLSTSVAHAPSGGLHVGARIDGAYVNPLLLLGELPPAVLLPLGDATRP